MSSAGGSVDRGQQPTTPIEGANGTTTTPPMDPGQAADGVGSVLPPELLFFAGGLLVLLAVATWAYYTWEIVGASLSRSDVDHRERVC